MSEQIANQDLPDPSITRFGDKYLLTFTTGNKVVLWSSPFLQDFHETNPTTIQRVLWYSSCCIGVDGRQPSGNIQMTDLWAPELHIVNNTWYVYFAADTPPKGNPTHRMYVLQGPASTIDPMAATSTFNLVGQIANLPNQWQIDGTVFTFNQVLYLVYSGWPLNDSSGLTQELFIAKMIDPVTAEPATTPAMISTPTYTWEKYTDPGPGGAVHAINEGPAWLQLDSFQGIVFSAGASWTSDYQLGVLQYLGGDPMQISSWRKFPQQFLCNNPDGQGPYGPGHCSYTPYICIDY